MFLEADNLLSLQTTNPIIFVIGNYLLANFQPEIYLKIGKQLSRKMQERLLKI